MYFWNTIANIYVVVLEYLCVTYSFILEVHIVVMQGYDGEHENVPYLCSAWGLNN